MGHKLLQDDVALAKKQSGVYYFQWSTLVNTFHLQYFIDIAFRQNNPHNYLYQGHVPKV